MSMDFPASPAVNDIFTPPGVGYSYIWDGVTWKVYSAGGIPPGQVSYFAMSTPPAGWLECNGALVSRFTYAALFAALGTLWGAGDGSTTFGLPDLRGFFIRSWNASASGFDPSRAFGGSQVADIAAHAHTASSAAETAEHTHTMSDTTTTIAAHTHVREAFSIVAGSGTLRLVPQGGGTDRSTEAGGSHAHTFSGTTSGRSASHTHAITVNNSSGSETRPVNRALLTCIKT